MTPREHADAFVRCFIGYVAKQVDPVNREHLRVATEWLRLIDAEAPAVADIEALRSSLDTLGFAGSATIDLKLSAGAWAARARREAIIRRPTT